MTALQQKNEKSHLDKVALQIYCYMISSPNKDYQEMGYDSLAHEAYIAAKWFIKEEQK